MKHLFLFSALIGIFCLAAGCSSEEIGGIKESTRYYGTVINSDTDEPYANITIAVTNGTETRLSTKTNPLGEFQLNLNIGDLSSGYYFLIGNNNTDNKKIAITGITRDEVDLGTIYISPMPLPVILSFTTKVQDNNTILLTAQVQTTQYSLNEVGFCYAKDNEPNINNNHVVKSELNGTSFSSNVNILDLEYGSTYYFKAYAKNNAGVGYSDVSKYSTEESEGSVNTLDVTNITSTAATLNGEIVKPGHPEYSERGFVYDTKKSPTITDAFEKISSPKTSNNTFSCNIDNLDPLQRYYVRTYIIQDGNTIYGNSVAFTTSSQSAVLSTSAVTDIGATSATFNATITNAGTPTYTERGFCYSTKEKPTIEDNHKSVEGNGTGNFSLTIPQLEYPVTYYVRAYVIQSNELVYGNEVSFTTIRIPTSVRTYSATNITSSSAILNGTVIYAGTPTYTEKGFCYGGYNPTINDKRIAVEGDGGGDFSIQLTNLEYNTTYYFRTYAIQDGKPVYGESLYFATDYTQAEVSTLDASNVKFTTATLNGSISELGDPQITERGFCYSEGYDSPSIINSKVIKVTGIINGDFKADVTDLKEDGAYYFRAYVIQNGELIYGRIKKFTTGYAPIVATGPAYNVSSTSASFQGQFLDGNPNVTECGFVYANTTNPTVNTGSKVQNNSLSETDIGSYFFKRTVNNLTPNRTYYYRAFVKTAYGYTYGETESFNTY